MLNAWLRRAGSASTWAVTLVTLLLLLVMGWATLSLTKAEQAAQHHNAEVNLGNLNIAAVEHVSTLIAGGDRMLQLVRTEYLEHANSMSLPAMLNGSAQPDGHDLVNVLVAVIGPDGWTRHLSWRDAKPFNVAEREYFRAMQGERADPLYISPAITGLVSGKPVVQLVRRIPTADGGFGGLVLYSLGVDQLLALYHAVDLGMSGSMAIVGTDGAVKLRLSGDSKIATNPPRLDIKRRTSGLAVGCNTMLSSFDGIEKLMCWRAIEPLGLTLFSTRSIEELDAGMRQRQSRYWQLAGLSALGFLLLAGVLLWRIGVHRTLTETLARRTREAESATGQKSRFLASMSHELRTPLNGILGYAELVRDTSTEPEVRDFGAVIHQSAEHLHQLVNTVLDLASVESGRMVLQPQPLTIDPLLRALIEQHRVVAHAKGLGLHLEIAAGSPHQLQTDRQRLLQVLNNLLHNAIKFSATGEVRLEVSADARGFRMQVSDQGCGIDAQRLTEIETGAQSLSGLPLPGQGAGMGLQLAIKLAEALGGALTISSTSGQGTQVRLSLPLAWRGAG